MAETKHKRSFFNSLLLIGCFAWLLTAGMILAIVIFFAYDDISTIQKKASAGNAAAQYRLGRAYERGAGLKKDMKEAFGWYHLSASRGNAGAMMALGRAYEEGVGGPAKPDRALSWYRAAVAAGSPAAHLRLARMYARGNSVPRDRTAAWAWRFKAVRAAYRHAVTSTVTTCRTAVRTVRTGIASVRETLALLAVQMAQMRATLNAS